MADLGTAPLGLSNDDFAITVQPPPPHIPLYIAWFSCSLSMMVLIVPGGMVAIHYLRWLRTIESHTPQRVVVDDYEQPVSAPFFPPQSCIHQTDSSSNLTHQLFREYGDPGGLSKDPRMEIFCYYNRSRVINMNKTHWYGIGSIPSTVCTYIIYGPMVVDVGQADIKMTPRDIILTTELVSRRATNKATLLLSVGGNGEFATMANLVGRMARLAGNIVVWVLKNGFQGVDIDWKDVGNQPCGRPGDGASLDKLVEELRRVSKINNFKPLLTTWRHQVPVLPGVDFYFNADSSCQGTDPFALRETLQKTKQWHNGTGKLCATVSATLQVFDNSTGRLVYRYREPYNDDCIVTENASCDVCCSMERKGMVYRYDRPASLTQKLTINRCVLYLDGDMDNFSGACNMPMYPILKAIAATVPAF
ncbi:hypothetical protein IscW_ISCW009893 [Ixodes scapularis]|uniref:GH18 domain-containing protein n=1 Tax=Ixodes scapularis TaxID=6945 RepID=B7PXL5_IXOSC|nr:hypothetical protein IscW_ISCW009893 [Ixodes scapularis]|eukprot:XP_002401238.1 hypothetical protein IscW_ISCW009893 [Ixodes scapularis]